MSKSLMKTNPVQRKIELKIPKNLIIDIGQLDFDLEKTIEMIKEYSDKDQNDETLKSLTILYWLYEGESTFRGKLVHDEDNDKIFFSFTPTKLEILLNIITDDVTLFEASLQEGRSIELSMKEKKFNPLNFCYKFRKNNYLVSLIYQGVNVNLLDKKTNEDFCLANDTTRKIIYASGYINELETTYKSDFNISKLVSEIKSTVEDYKVKIFFLNKELCEQISGYFLPHYNFNFQNFQNIEKSFQDKFMKIFGIQHEYLNFRTELNKNFFDIPSNYLIENRQKIDMYEFILDLHDFKVLDEISKILICTNIQNNYVQGILILRSSKEIIKNFSRLNKNEYSMDKDQQAGNISLNSGSSKKSQIIQENNKTSNNMNPVNSNGSNFPSQNAPPQSLTKFESSCISSQKLFKFYLRNEEILKQYLQQGKFIIKTIVGRFYTFDKKFILDKFKNIKEFKEYLVKKIFDEKLDFSNILIYEENSYEDNQEIETTQNLVDDDSEFDEENEKDSSKPMIYSVDFPNTVLVFFKSKDNSSYPVNIPDFFTTNDLYNFIYEKLKTDFSLYFDGKYLENSSLTLKSAGFKSGNNEKNEITINDNKI